MVARTGEKAQKTGTFHCRNCDFKVQVKKSDTIPNCPCGKNEYDKRTDKRGRESSKK